MILADRIHAANEALLAERRLDAIEEFFAHDYVVHYGAADTARGHAGVRRALGMLHAAFPEVRVSVDVLVPGSDRVAWMRTLRGVHRGDYGGFPANGREVTWREMVTSAFRDGRIAEEWLVSDLAERLLRARKG